jgi:hypothetical protein
MRLEEYGWVCLRISPQQRKNLTLPPGSTRVSGRASALLEGRTQPNTSPAAGTLLHLLTAETWNLRLFVATAVVGTTTGSPLGEAAEMAAPKSVGTSLSLMYGAAELADSTSRPTSCIAQCSERDPDLSSDSESESD